MRKSGFRRTIITVLLLIVLTMTQTLVFAADGPRKRSDIPDQYKWNLERIYATSAAWEKDLGSILKEYVPKMNSYKGKLTKADNVLKCLNLYSDMSRLAEKVYVYANMKFDENQGDSDASERLSKAESMNTQVLAATAFIQPELLSQPEKVIKGYIADKAFAGYKMYFDKLLKEKFHTLSKSEEELLANVSLLASAPNDIYSKLKNADMTFEKIKNEKGEEVKVTNSSYGQYLENPSRDVRKAAFDSIYKEYDKLKNTFAATLSAEVNKNVFFAKTRKYNSALEAALASENIPRSVYDSLVKSINENNAALHKYVSMRKKILNVDKVHLYDMYVPVVDNVRMKITYDEALKMLPDAMSPLGSEYVATVRKGLSDRWIDVYETEGKYSGGYSWGTYDTTPYILLNYDDTVDSFVTLAHEMGHSINTYYSNKTQNYMNSAYPIFTAEVASTTNEFISYDYLINNAKSDDEKLYLLNSLIENIRGTVFTQVMYAEFEQTIHERVEKGEALSADTLDKIWGDLMAKYYGSDFETDEYAKLWWARIPHFYMDFYVYKYATSMAYSYDLYSQMKGGDKRSTEKYLAFLKAGGSDYSVEILKNAGVDPTSKVPVSNLVEYFGKLVDQMESILEKQGKIK